MCSMRWLRPASGSSSAEEPVPIHRPRATERTDSIRSVTTRTPEGRTVRRWPSSPPTAPSASGGAGGCSSRAAARRPPWSALATLRIAAGAGAVTRAPGATAAAVALAVTRRTVTVPLAVAARAAAAGAVGGAHGGELLDALARDLGVLGQAQPDAPALAVDLDHAHGDLVALVEDVLDGVDPLAGRHVGDVQQAVGALGELDERPERGGLDHLADERVADLDLLGHRPDALG